MSFVTSVEWPVDTAVHILPRMARIPKAWRRTYLKDWREAADLTQEELASAIGCSAPYLSLLENGKRRYHQDQLEKAALALGTTPWAILNRRPPKPGHTDPDALWESMTSEERARALTIYRAATGAASN